MLTPRDRTLIRVGRFMERSGEGILDELGSGYDDTVFATDCQHAIKVFRFAELYERERDVYLRLWERQITSVRGCAVPQLVNYDNELWIVVMSVVRRPFVLDFAGAYLDTPPDFPQDVLDDWRAAKEEQFGERWPEVEAIMRAFARLGIFLSDANPGNIGFED